MINIYRRNFRAKCPNNDESISYDLAIRTTETIMVETICKQIAESIKNPVFHESLADDLKLRIGGDQVLTAFHHGVDVETHR